MSDKLSKKIESSVKEEIGRADLSSKIEASLSDATQDDITASFVNQQDLGEPGMENSFARLAIADANTAHEKLNAFKKHYPEGDLVATPVTGELVFREDKSKAFKKVDADMMEKFEPLGDIIDFFGSDIGAIAGEIALTKGSGSILGMLTRLFAGGAIGDAAQQGLQEARGVNEQTVGDIIERGATQGTISTIGGGIGYGIGKGLDVATGGGFFGLAPGADKAMGAAERLDIKGLTPGQAAEAPIVKRVEGQAGAVLPTVQRYYDKQNQAAADVLLKMQDKRTAGKMPESLIQAHNRERGKILSMATGKAKTMSEGGEALQKGIKEYDDIATASVNKAYADARALGDAKFDISEMQELAGEMSNVAKSLDADGNVINIAGNYSKEFQSVLDDITSLNPELPQVDKFTSVDQLRALRERLYELKSSPAGVEPTRENKIAANLYRKITETLRNPVGGDPRFRAAWDKANEEAAKRFSTLDKIQIIQAAKTESPAQLANRLQGNMQVDNLRVLRGAIPSKRFAEFQDSFKTNLVANPDSITRTLGKIDKESLDILLSKEEQRIYRQIGNAIDDLNLVGVRKALDKQSEIGGLVNELFVRNKSKQIDRLATLIEENGGRSSPLGQQVRSGLIDNIVDQVLIKDGGKVSVNQRALSNILENYSEKGLLKFLTVSDKKRLADLELLAPFLRTKADVGTSIQAAEQARGMVSSIGDIASGQGFKGAALQALIEHIGVGKIFTSRVGQWLLLGSGKDLNIRNYAARMGAALQLTASDIDKYSAEDFNKIAEALAEEDQ